MVVAGRLPNPGAGRGASGGKSAEEEEEEEEVGICRRGSSARMSTLEPCDALQAQTKMIRSSSCGGRSGRRSASAYDTTMLSSR